MEIRYNYLVIEGNIGVGKTTLASKIANDFNARLILETFVDNPFLPKFYNNPEKYSFQLELSFLASRYKQLKEEFVTPDSFKTFAVADYYFTKSLVFAASTLKKNEFELYKQIFSIVYSSLPKPDLYVYLHLSPEKLLENIKKRGRSYETGITESYLKTIQENYFAFFDQSTDIKYLIIDISQIDFVENEEDYEKILNTILKKDYSLGLNEIIL